MIDEEMRLGRLGEFREILMETSEDRGDGGDRGIELRGELGAPAERYIGGSWPDLWVVQNLS